MKNIAESLVQRYGNITDGLCSARFRIKIRLRIRWLYHLQRCKTPNKRVCPGYDTKLSGSKVPVLEIWGVWITTSLPLLPDPLWSGVVVFVRVPFMGQIELFNHLSVCKQMIAVELNYIPSIGLKLFDSTVCKKKKKKKRKIFFLKRNYTKM